MPSKKKAPAKKAAKAPSKPAGKAKAAPKAKAKAKAPAKPKAAAKPSPAAKPKAKPPADATIREAMAKSEAPRLTVRGMITEMIAEQKHTDQEILDAVSKAIPDKTVNFNIIGATRSEMNFGRRLPEGFETGHRFEQILCVDGVNMPRSKRPPKPGKPRKPARGKVKPENDPLEKLGIPAVKRTPARKAPASVAA